MPPAQGRRLAIRMRAQPVNKFPARSGVADRRSRGLPSRTAGKHGAAGGKAPAREFGGQTAFQNKLTALGLKNFTVA